jgi:hypothetical protein
MLRAAAASLAVALLAAGEAQAKPGAADPVLGVWRGKYVCGQGVTALTLTVSVGAPAPTPAGPRGFAPVQKSTPVAARFDFGPVKANPLVPKGSYTMSGVYYPSSRRIVLQPEAWRIAPLGYFMVGLDGRMTAEGDRISGEIKDASCGAVELERLQELMS